MGINLWGVIYGCRTFIPRFKEQKRGHILNIASAAGLLCTPALAPYNVTKAGVVALSECLHAELKQDGIGVTVLCPTFFRTNIAKSSRSHGDANPDIAEKLMNRTTIQAADVARNAIEALDNGRLYALPHPDGRWFWRLKRVAPETFYDKVLTRARSFMK